MTVWYGIGKIVNLIWHVSLPGALSVNKNQPTEFPHENFPHLASGLKIEMLYGTVVKRDRR